MNTPETMTKHDFSDLTPPDDLVMKWIHDEDPTAKSLTVGGRNVITTAYRAGAEQAAERLASQWPEPITNRAPTEADGDDYGYVMTVDGQGYWHSRKWSSTAEYKLPWRHSPRWQPPAPPTLKEQAIQAFKRRYPKRQYFDDGTGNAVEVNAELFADLDLILRALEADS